MATLAKLTFSDVVRLLDGEEDARATSPGDGTSNQSAEKLIKLLTRHYNFDKHATERKLWNQSFAGLEWESDDGDWTEPTQAAEVKTSDHQRTMTAAALKEHIDFRKSKASYLSRRTVAKVRTWLLTRRLA